MFTLDNFYKSDKWRNLIDILRNEREQDGILYCEHCGKPIVKKYDCIGHHKIELTNANVNDYEVSLNPENIMLIHHKCHNIIHERFGYERPKQVYIVYGPPCSGKSSYVCDVAGCDDIILDIDSIWEMISNNDRYVKRDRLKENVFGIRDCILDQIRMRVGKWKNAYIIGGYPMKMDRTRLEQRLGASSIFIFEDKEVCLERARMSERHGWDKYIEEWFERYSP